MLKIKYHGRFIVFGVGISLGNVLLKTGAAQWLSDQTFGVLGLKHLPYYRDNCTYHAF